MANWNDPQPTRPADRAGFGASPGLNGDVQSGTTMDQGLRRHMLSIYNYMASGVLLSGVVALLMANSGMAQAMMASPVKWLVMLAPLGFVLAINFGVNKFSTGTLQLLFWAFAAVMGMSLSTIFLIYTEASIAGTFFATAGAFAGLSLFGYTTKRNLGPLGTFLSMGVIGLILAMIVNMIWPMPGLAVAIPFIGVLIFAGLTAYDTQRLKREYEYLRGTDFAGKAVILGALTLYLDFINMFQFLLSFMGSRD